MAWHRVNLAPLLVQPHPQASVLCANILNLHSNCGADSGEGIDHERDQRSITQAGMVGSVDAVEQMAGLRRVQNCGLASAHYMARTAYRGRRIRWYLLPDHHPVEEMADGSELLLHGRRRDFAALQLDPCSYVQRLDLGQGSDAPALALGEKFDRSD